MKSWKTTSAGIAAIAGALITLWFKRAALDESLIMGAITAVLTGIGLITARDADVTSEGTKTK